jgi:hypothetical protein
MRGPALIPTTFLYTALSATTKAQIAENDFLVRTTGDLVSLCASQPSDPLYTAAQNFCQGYAVGVYQTVKSLPIPTPVSHLILTPRPRLSGAYPRDA